MKLAALLLSVIFLFSFELDAQTIRSLRGIVKDSSGVVIEAATVKVLTAKDTVSSTTDKNGQFKLENIKTAVFTLAISSAGFETFTSAYEFKKDQSSMDLEAIVLKVKIHELQEVVVKSVIVPVTAKEDTLEYDARAYQVRKGDFVNDLLKQLPGVEVDKDGNVKAGGKEMTKLRVNGEDFFTGDVTTFIKQLPANIVSKLQVIDDYGDNANFTGIKTGEPRKMLNLVTKPGMNKGTFNSASASAGTHGVVSAAANSNLWRDRKQVSANGNLSYADKNSLVSNNSGASASYRDNWGKKFSFNVDYNYNNSRSKSNGSSYNETIYPTGSLYTNTNYASEYRSQGHNLQLGFNYNKDKSNYLNFRGSIGYNAGNNTNTTISEQKGLVFQDLQNAGSSTHHTPTYSGSGSYSHRFKKPGRLISVSFNIGSSANNNTQHLSDRTQYYQDSTRANPKDSTLERLVQTGSSSANTGISITYSEPVNKTNYLDFSYNYSSRLSNSTLVTNAATAAGMYEFVDSLSNTYHNTAGNKTFAFNYRHTAKTINYTAGVQVQPNSILGEYEGRKEAIHYASTNFSPVANLRVALSKTSSANINYSGQSTSPDINELQPVKDTRNLQNVIVGNPDLKTSFRHSLNFSFNELLAKKGTMLVLSASGSTVKNQVVTDRLLFNDTLTRSFKQETHFRNVSGNYNLGGNYSITQPFFDRKLNIDYSGRLGYSRTISYADNILNVGNDIHFSQSFRFQLYTKSIGVSGGVQYGNNKNKYTTGINRDISAETWNYNLSANLSVFKKLRVGLDANKQVSNGYYQSIANNPLYLNANASFSFLKNDVANLHLQLNDLLNQGNIPYRMVTGNSVTDTRTTTVTRYLLLTLSVQLNKFGGSQ